MLVENISISIIKDSVGKKTAEASINGFSASYPEGTSTGQHELIPLEPEKAISRFRTIEKQFIGEFDQKSFDTLLMKNIKKLGTGLTTPLSMAFFSANYKQINRFPNLLANVFGGGSHASSAINIQEILVIPREKAIPLAVNRIKKIWKETCQNIPRNIPKKLTLENAWTANISNTHALEIVADIAEKNNARIGLDIAASQLYHNGKYKWQGMRLDRKEFLQEMLDIINSYDIFYIEDPVHEKDPKAYAYLKNRTNALICGDDLIATNLARLKKYKDCINSVIVKPNQAGIITGCMDVIEYSSKRRIMPVVSHRSRSTMNTVISKLATHAPLAKLGAAGYGLYRLEALVKMWKSCKRPKMAKIKL
ncbi:MAG: hypothetical protein HZB65_04360 [Candidatus Aenigmarchaeota archaeon]|nr:hypothetical protein [Candidatus Aenigmarchaeota archaeon]